MSTNPSPAIAALLSFIFPGAGQIYAGDVRKGVIWAIPMVLFIGVLALLLLGGSSAMLGLISSPEKRVALLVVNVAFFLYHLAAMLDAYQVVRHERMRTFGASRAAPIALAVLVALTMVMHGVPEVIGVDVHNSFSRIFPGGRGDDVIPSFNPGTPAPATPTPLVTPSPQPTATPSSGSPGTPTPGGSGSPQPTETPRVCPPIDLGSWAMASDGRVNILLVGSDSRSETGVGDVSLRTDSMMLLSIDVASCKAALFSFPRNMKEPSPDSRYPSWFRIQLENGQTYPGFLFGLWRDAASSPQQYPGSEGIGSECQFQFECVRGWRALTGAIQNMTGVPVDGVVAVNLKGFVDVVNNLPGGGLWLDVPRPGLVDDAYYNSRQELMPLNIKPGCDFFDGEMTLAYARSRHQDSDYQRGRRQQYVLQQVRKQLHPVALLPHIPALLNVASANLFMTIDDGDIPNLAQVAARIDADRLYRYDFAPAKMTALGSAEGMRDKVRNIFDEPEPRPTTRPDQEPCPPRN